MNYEKGLRPFFLFPTAMISTHKPHIMITQYDSENSVLLLQITSNLDNITELVVDAESFANWQNGMLIQRCFPELPVNIRELMISGMDLETQEEFFANPNEEED